MTTPHPLFQGIWLPLVTPFRNGALDEISFRRMVGHYAGSVDGFVLAATTGEGFALSRDETQRLAEWTTEELVARGVQTPVILGICSAVTSSVVEAIRAAEAWPQDGFLITCPYYVHPSQDGLLRHFEAIADSTPSNILVYNIPYRAAVNMTNETMLRLAERSNIVGVKDCCADAIQSAELVRCRPAGFSVLTGEDAEVMSALRQGADGGVVASAHIAPDGFGDLYRLARDRRWPEAEQAWTSLAGIPELLFSEPSPAALKHALWRMGLIDSPELRLPMVPASAALAARLDALLARHEATTASRRDRIPDIQLS
jgi:4-hydroxy-tetrahydrodipicolinate synthase